VLLQAYSEIETDWILNLNPFVFVSQTF
jgi:hypothetical protein